MVKTFETFLSEKGLTKESFAAKSAGEMAGLYNEYNDSVRTELSKAIEGKASNESIAALKAELEAAKDVQFKSLNDKLKSQEEELKEYGIQIKKLSTQEKAAKGDLYSDIQAGLKNNLQKLKALGRDRELSEARNAGFSFKVAGTMLFSSNVSGGNVPVEQRISGLNTVASRQSVLLNIVSKGTASSNVISWVYQANKDGTAGGTAEGATKNQIDFDLVVASENVTKQTAYIKVSEEMMTDTDFIASEINNELMRELVKAIESGAYSGDGVDPNLNGIRTVATAFAAGDFALAIDNANEADVIRVAINQIQIANQPMPTYVLMHPTDVTKLKVMKVSTTDKRYIDALQLIAGELTIDGVPIIPTTLVTAGQYLVGVFNLATLYDKGEISIQVGLDGNDFTKNLVTIRAEWRGAMIVKNNDRTAFVKGVFATDKAALETA